MQLPDQREAHRAVGAVEPFLLPSIYSDDTGFRNFISFCYLYLHVNCYWYVQESVPFQSRLFSRLKTTAKSVVCRAPGVFCTMSKRFLRNNGQEPLSCNTQESAVLIGKKFTENKSVKDQYAYFQQVFFSLFLSCWEGKKNFIRSYSLCQLVSAKLNLLRLLSLTNRWLSRGESIQICK